MRIARLPESVIVAQRPVLQNLLGLLGGRVYYNINNWYRMLLHLPAFRRNKQDMERDGLDSPVDFVSDESVSPGQRLARLPWLISILVRMRCASQTLSTRSWNSSRSSTSPIAASIGAASQPRPFRADGDDWPGAQRISAPGTRRSSTICT